jgi:hypothetical protein
MDMPSAHFMQLCLDVVDDVDPVDQFWRRVLSADRQWLRLQPVREAKTVKNRVHPDIYVRTLDELAQLGARVTVPEGDDRRWTVMVDVAGNEFCAFLRDPVPQAVLHGIGIDCADPRGLASWWGDILGGEVTHSPRGFSTVEAGPGRPFTLDFDAVPEPKTVQNRMHWDVRSESVTTLLDKGASLLSGPQGDADRYLLADPQGNEFCVFPSDRGADSIRSH